MTKKHRIIAISFLILMMTNHLPFVANARNCLEVFSAKNIFSIALGKRFSLLPDFGLLRTKSDTVALTSIEVGLLQRIAQYRFFSAPLVAAESFLVLNNIPTHRLWKTVEDLNDKIESISGSRPLKIKMHREEIYLELGPRFDFVEVGPLRLNPANNQISVFSKVTNQYESLKTRTLAYSLIEYMLRNYNPDQPISRQAYFQYLVDTGLMDTTTVFSAKFLANLRSQISYANQSFRTATGTTEAFVKFAGPHIILILPD